MQIARTMVAAPRAGRTNLGRQIVWPDLAQCGEGSSTDTCISLPRIHNPTEAELKFNHKVSLQSGGDGHLFSPVFLISHCPFLQNLPYIKDKLASCEEHESMALSVG